VRVLVHHSVMGRARKRLIGEFTIDAIALDLAAQALVSGEWQFDCRTGGSVANKYPAQTETALWSASPGGDVVVWRGSASANKVSLAGAARSCLTCAADLFDERTGEPRKDRARVAIACQASKELAEATTTARLTDRGRAPSPETLMVARDACLAGQPERAEDVLANDHPDVHATVITAIVDALIAWSRTVDQ
jgi:hypothetical protein